MNELIAGSLLQEIFYWDRNGWVEKIFTMS